MVLEGFNSPDWYWVPAAAASLVVVLGTVVINFALRVV